MIRTLFHILLQPRYLLLAVCVSGVVFTFALWLPNFSLIGTVVFTSEISLLEKFLFLGRLYGSITTNFTIVSATYTIATSVLFGINVALLWYYIKSVTDASPTLTVTGATSIGGLVSGILGVGCAACGTFIVTSALSVVGAAGIITVLPFGGQEFGFIAVFLLFFSIYTILHKIQTPKICPII